MQVWSPGGHGRSVPDFCRSLLSHEAIVDLPRITGQDLLEVTRAEREVHGRWVGWAWNEIQALPLAWFSVLAILLDMVELTEGLLDGYIAMIPKADGDSTPEVSAPLLSYL